MLRALRLAVLTAPQNGVTIFLPAGSKISSQAQRCDTRGSDNQYFFQMFLHDEMPADPWP